METTKEQINVNLLSRKLMDGWSLMKEECPNDCKIALVSKDNKIFCVNCENYYRKDGNGMLWYSRPNEPVVTLPSPTLKELSQILPLPPSSPDIQNYHLVSSSKENGHGISHKLPSPTIGRKLDFSTPYTPIIRDPIAPKTSSPLISTTGTSFVQSSSKVAQKLLEGWTLVGRGCSKCNSTLVADKTNRPFCVTCNTYDAILTSKVPLIQSNGTKESVALILDNGKSSQSILEKTIKSLYDKMEAARELLDHTSNISDCNKLVTLIAECGNSIKILQSLSI